MRFLVFCVDTALLMLAMSSASELPSANLTFPSVGCKNSTYSPLPPSDPVPVSNPEGGSNWSLYHTGGLILFLLSVSVGIWRRYQTEIESVFSYICHGVQSTFGRNQTPPASCTHPHHNLNAGPQAADIARPRPVMYNQHRLPVYRANQGHIPPSRYTPSDYRTRNHLVGPSTRIPSRRADSVTAFEEDIEMNAFGTDNWTSYDI